MPPNVHRPQTFRQPTQPTRAPASATGAPQVRIAPAGGKLTAPPAFSPVASQHAPSVGPAAATNAVPSAAGAATDLSPFAAALTSNRRSMNAALQTSGFARHAGRAVTAMGTLGAIGAGVATGAAVLAGIFGGLSGIGMPVAAAAALGGIGVALAGVGVAVTAGAITRRLARNKLAAQPGLAEKLKVLREVQKTLQDRPKLTKAERKILRETTVQLGKFQGFGQQLKSQLKVAGKTTVVPVVGAFVLALSAAFGESAGSGSLWPVWITGGPSLTLAPENGKPLAAADAEVRWSDPAQAQRWLEVLQRS